MSSTTLSLILAAASVHAMCNSVAKKAPGGAVFVFLYSVAAAIQYFPLTPAIGIYPSAATLPSSS